jgi:hypothetical protein
MLARRFGVFVRIGSADGAPSLHAHLASRIFLACETFFGFVPPTFCFKLLPCAGSGCQQLAPAVVAPVLF